MSWFGGNGGNVGYSSGSAVINATAAARKRHFENKPRKLGFPFNLFVFNGLQS
jgi:hypothetical protein